MPRVTATRSELLARRAQIALAVQGRDLLKEKRNALKQEFDRLSATVLEAMETLEARCAEGREVLAEALALDGPEAVGSAALAAAGQIEVDVKTKVVAGVSIVEVEREAAHRPRTGRGYGLSTTTARIDRTAAAYETQVDLLLDVVATELSLRRLANEIQATTRRVNALEHVVIPGLEEERDAIAIVLEERELEDRVRLVRARGPREHHRLLTGRER